MVEADTELTFNCLLHLLRCLIRVDNSEQTFSTTSLSIIIFQAGLSLSLNRAGLLPAGVGLEPPPEAAPESLDSPSFGGHRSQPLHRPRNSEGPGGSVLEEGGV